MNQEITITYEDLARERPRIVVEENGTLTLKMLNLPDVNVPLSFTLLIQSLPASGGVLLALAADSQESMDALLESNKQDTTDQTKTSLTTNKETFTEFVTTATTDGTQPTIPPTTGI